MARGISILFVIIILSACSRKTDVVQNGTACDLREVSGETPLSLDAYHTFSWYDIRFLEGHGEAVDTPFVYVRELRDTIVVRVSNDIENPYVIIDHGDYKHCKWLGDERGDSVLVDRFIYKDNFCEYIQRLGHDGCVEREFRVTDLDINQQPPGMSVYDEVIYMLESSREFDFNAGDSFPQIWNEHLSTECVGKNVIIEGRKNNKDKPDCRVIRNREGRDEEVYYSTSSLGLYDEHKDVNRPKFIRRI